MRCCHLPFTRTAPQSEPQWEPPRIRWYIGMKAVMPLEVEIPSLRVLIDFELEKVEWAKVRYI